MGPDKPPFEPEQSPDQADAAGATVGEVRRFSKSKLIPLLTALNICSSLPPSEAALPKSNTNQTIDNASGAVHVKIKQVLTKKKKPKKSPDILRGSKSAIAKEDAAVSKLGGPFKDYKALQAALKNGELVAMGSSPFYTIDSELGELVEDEGVKELYKSLRPHTAQLLRGTAKDFYNKFKIPLSITSLTRTSAYIDRLIASGNSNARRNSSHTAGITFDISFAGLQPEQRNWLETRFRNLEIQGIVQATKERGQPCYHVADMLAKAPKPKSPVLPPGKKKHGKTHD